MKLIVDDNKQTISRPLALSTINLAFYEMISSKVGWKLDKGRTGRCSRGLNVSCF